MRRNLSVRRLIHQYRKQRTRLYRRNQPRIYNDWLVPIKVFSPLVPPCEKRRPDSSNKNIPAHENGRRRGFDRASVEREEKPVQWSLHLWVRKRPAGSRKERSGQNKYHP